MPPMWNNGMTLRTRLSGLASLGWSKLSAEASIILRVYITPFGLPVVPDEYMIMDAEEARGRDVNTVVWICETPSGDSFKVRPKGSLEKREFWLKNKLKFIGKFLTVQYQNLTDAGIPRFPVGIGIRDYE